MFTVQSNRLDLQLLNLAEFRELKGRLTWRQTPIM